MDYIVRYKFLILEVISLGQPTRLTNGIDFRAELCGVNDLSNLPY